MVAGTLALYSAPFSAGKASTTRAQQRCEIGHLQSVNNGTSDFCRLHVHASNLRTTQIKLYERCAGAARIAQIAISENNLF